MNNKKTIEEILAMQNKKQRARSKEEEHRIQSACVRWFGYQYPTLRGLLFAIPNGGARSKATAGKLKAEGVVAGVSDLIMLVPNKHHHSLCIEMKTQKGKQSPAQKEWQVKAESEGNKYIICRSLDDFMNEIKDYLSEY